MHDSGVPAGCFERLRARWSDRSAVRTFDRLSADGDPTRHGLTRAAAVTVSVLVLLVVTGLVAGLVRWTLHASGPQWVGVVLAWLVVLALRPRRNPLPADVQVLEARQYPGLHGLVAETARAVGVRPPRLVGVDLELNASVAAVGWRRRSALVLGLPLMSLGTWDLRVAVLAHELGHLRGRDTVTGRLVGSAGSLLEGVRFLLSPTRATYQSGRAEGPFGHPVAAARARVAQGFANLVVAVAVLPAVVLDVVLELLESSSRQRDEYLADRRGARLVGSTAMAAALAWDVVGVGTATAAAVRRGEDPYAVLLARPDPSAAQVAARAAEAPVGGRRADAGHPPDALRIRLLLEHPVPSSVDGLQTATVVAAEAEIARLREATRKHLADQLRSR